MITIRHTAQRRIYGEKTHDDLTAPQQVRMVWSGFREEQPLDRAKYPWKQ